MVAQDVGEVVMGWVGCEEGEGKEGKGKSVFSHIRGANNKWS